MSFESLEGCAREDGGQTGLVRRGFSFLRSMNRIQNRALSLGTHPRILTAKREVSNETYDGTFDFDVRFSRC